MLRSRSAPSLEQAAELSAGMVPRELESIGEAPASWALLPTPVAADANGHHTRSGPRSGEPYLPGAVIGLLPTPKARDWKGTGPANHARKSPDLNAVLLPTPTTRDHHGAGEHGPGGANLRTVVADALLPTPRATDGTKGGPNQHGSSGDLMLSSAVQPDRWGRYGAAIARWEAVLDRTAPDPTEPGSKGQPRLSPRFVEWLMGADAGTVTTVPGVSRAGQLARLGNGVVPQQAAAAVRLLLGRAA